MKLNQLFWGVLHKIRLNLTKLILVSIQLEFNLSVPSEVASEVNYLSIRHPSVVNDLRIYGIPSVVSSYRKWLNLTK